MRKSVSIPYICEVLNIPMERPISLEDTAVTTVKYREIDVLKDYNL